jgi:hypothetical protein
MKMKTYSTPWLVMAILACVALSVIILASQPVRAAGPWYVAPGGSDGNDCLDPATACDTINGALNKPGFVAGDTILVATGVYTSTVDQVVLLNKNVVLSGGWDADFTTPSGASTIDGQGARRGITVYSDVHATIEHFVVQNGWFVVGAGIYNTGGTLTLNNSTVCSNEAFFEGGGIYNGAFSTLTLNNSTVRGNTADYGGGIYNWQGTLALNNSTVSGNTATGSGGGIYNDYGTATLNNSTVSGNTATSTGGGIYNSDTVTLQNSILDENTAGSTPDCSGTIGSVGYNLIGNTSGCTFTPGSGDLTNVNANLGSLIGVPGKPKYHPLLPGSPAIDAGNPAGCMGSAGLLTTDQRGAARVGRCDIGAYEYTTPGLAGTIYAFAGTPQHAPPFGVFGVPLQAGVLDSIGSPVNNSTVTFSAPASGASGTFSNTGTFTTTAVTNESGVATAATFTANGVAGSYAVTATVSGIITQASFSLGNFLWYVTTDGNDNDDCLSPAKACATINGALNKPGFIADDTILVATGVYTGTGTEVVLLDKSATLFGGWDAGFTTQGGASTIDGQEARRGMTVISNVTGTIEHFIIQRGEGGIFNNGTITLNNSTIVSNTASSSDWGGIFNGGGTLVMNDSAVNGNQGLDGGGILNSGGTVTLNDSSVSNNNSYTGGGIYSSGTLTLNNSTVSGNTAFLGGGIYNDSTGTVNLNNCTISNNTATGDGGGICVNAGVAFSLQNTILAGNTAPSGPDCYNATINSVGYNLLGNISYCTYNPSTGDLINIDPELGPLQDNGGATLTHALLPGSPAIDAGNPAGCMGSTGLLTTDQRGFYRPVDGDSNGVAICDMGAYEFQQAIFLYPATQYGSGAHGATVEYPILLSNWTILTDTYSLTLGPHAWQTTLSTNSLGPVAHGDSLTFTVYITIPMDTAWYLTDAVTITATSVTSPTIYSDTATITTQAYAPPQISVSPDMLTSTQDMNEIVTQPLTINNGHGVTLTFTLATGMFFNGLVAYYPFNGNANDESGNGNDGTIMGPTLTTDRFGNPDSAYSFDGTDDYIRVPDNDSLDLSDGLTIMAWIKSENTEGARDIVVKWNDNTSDRSYIFKDWDYGDKLSIELAKENNEVLASLQSTTSIATGEWIFVATTFDSNTVKLYLNGAQDTSSTATGIIRASATDMLIGAVFTWGGIYQNFDGVIDDVRIYNRALTPDEILELYSWQGGSDVPWLSTTPVSGTVTSNNSVPVQVTFDATGMQPGEYTTDIVVRSNDPVTPLMTVPVTMTVTPVTPTAVMISGPDAGWTGESQVFMAAVEPISTTFPITYAWQATGQDTIIHTGGITDTVAYTWQSPGAQIITITATNVAGSVMDTHIITITTPSYPLYLPIIQKEQQTGYPASGVKQGTVGFLVVAFSGGAGVGLWLRRKRY